MTLKVPLLQLPGGFGTMRKERDREDANFGKWNESREGRVGVAERDSREYRGWDFPLKGVTPGNGVEKIRPSTRRLRPLREQDVGVHMVRKKDRNRAGHRE
jgi:hypothetical protein